MGYGMDELADCGGELYEMQVREDAVSKGLVVIGGITIDPNTVSMKRLRGIKARFRQLADDGVGDDWDQEIYEAFAEIAEHAWDKRTRNGEEVEDKFSKSSVKISLDKLEEVKAAAHGAEVNCPECNKVFTKRHPAQAFCSNGRTRKGGNCKDRFWNRCDPHRAARQRKYINHR